MRTKHARVRSGGFSLIELMIVVVITGVLAATAIPTFTTYIYKSRTGEAVAFLGVIKLRQEAYRAEFGQYLVCGTMKALSTLDTMSNLTPARGTPASASVAWTGNACFNTLGASPDGAVRFSYGWAAGTPVDFASSGVGAALGLTTADHYFVAQGRADLDDDGEYCVFEYSNFQRNVWIGDTSGNDLAAGYE